MKRRWTTALLSAIGMAILILDSKTALQGATEGVNLCIRVVIPSLLPFFILSMLLTGSLTGSKVPFLSPIAAFCGVPMGGETLLLVGLLGGYPVGAQNIAASYKGGYLSYNQAHRLLGFCSNAGPAFLFGIVAAKFDAWWITWLLWAIHIVSSLLVGFILPEKEASSVRLSGADPLTVETALRRSIAVMAQVCGWIILFRVILSFLDRWVFWLLPEDISVMIAGVLELTNGCCQLERIENPGLRFVAAASMVSFGGLCVLMQTKSVAADIGIGSYLKGKLWQTFFSILLSCFIQLLIFPEPERMRLHPVASTIATVILAILAVIFRECEKNSSNPRALRV